MNNSQNNRSFDSSDIQNKASNFFSIQSILQTYHYIEKKLTTSIPSNQSLQDKSDIYNFSEVTEKNEEEQDDIAIVNFIDASPSLMKKKGNKGPPPKAIGQKPSSSSVQKRKPHQFNKLGDKDKEQIFLNTYDENLKLKQSQQQLESYYQQMEVKFRTLENHMHSTKNGGDPKLNNTMGGEKSDKQDLQFQQLKEQIRLKEQENEKLKQKFNALASAHKVVSAKQPPQRNIQPSSAEHRPVNHQSQVGETQIKDLLKLNDMLKKRCLEQESQIRSLQQMMNSKVINNKDLTDKNMQFVTLKERYEKMEAHLQAQRNQLEEERKRQSEILSLLKDERAKTHDLQQQVHSMELMTKSAEDLGMDLSECKRQKFELEEKLKILMESPFFKDFNERATTQARLRTIENELSSNKQEIVHMKDINARLDTENKIRKQELSEMSVELKKKYEECKELQMQMGERDRQLAPFKDLNYWDNDQFLKVLGNLKWTGEDPAWRKIEFIDRTYLDSDDPNVLRKEIEHLKLEKGELAAHLEKTQTLLKTRQDIEQEREKINKSELEKVGLQLKQAIAKCTEYAKIADLNVQAKQQRTLFEAEGVKYDDSVSVFSVDPNEDDQLQAGENFFDLYIGNAQLEAAGIQNSYQYLSGSKGAVDPQSLLKFLTVDFYDHETQHTSVSEGTNCAFNLQVSFKIVSDAALIQYLESGSLKIELYMSQGSDAIKLGTGQISLRDLVHKNNIEGVSTVISGHITINGPNNLFVGIVQYKARMRQPISQIIKWLKEQQELHLDEYDHTDDDAFNFKKRKLVVVIDKATQMPNRSNTFVYYCLDNKDYNTSTQPGNNPRWDYRMVHDIQFNQEFTALIRKCPLEIFVIDDNQPLTADGQSDKLGVASIDLNGLINNEMVDIAAEIRNDAGDRVGTLYIKVFWYETMRDEDPQVPMNTGFIQQTWEDTITMKIAAAIRQSGLNSNQAFKLFDYDKDDIVSYEDFANALKNVFAVRLNLQEMQLFYQKMQQPLNLINFDLVFRRLIGEGTQQIEEIPDLNRINQMVMRNSTKLPYQSEKQEGIRKLINDTLQNKIKNGKTKAQLFDEIDSGKRDGLIIGSELSGWLKYQGVQLSENDVTQFLIQFSDRDSDNKINIKEFFDYVLVNAAGTINRQNSIQSQESYQDPVTQALTSILQYSKTNNKTLMQIRSMIDQNSNGYVQREELRQFMQLIGINIDSQGMEKIFQFFDTNKDKLISMQEFSDSLSKVNKSKQILKQQYSFTHVSDYITQYLLNYMKTNKENSLAQLFNEIDDNNDGYLSQKEMKNIFKTRILVPLDQEEFDMFYLHFDSNNDNKISIREFVAVLQPAISRNEQQFKPDPQNNQIQRQQSTDLAYLQQLTQKAEEICGSNTRILLQSFELKEESRNSGFITPQNFRDILGQLNIGLSNTELDKLIDGVCDKNKAGLINYISFVNLGKRRQPISFDQTSNSGFGSLSQLDQERAMNKAKEVFSRISRAMSRLKVKADAAKIFKSFDTDNNKKITKQEMSQAFSKMNIKLTEEDKNMIFQALDKNADGSIGIEEFCKWIDL